MCIGLLQNKINKHPYTVLVCINCCLIKLGNNTKDSTISYNDRRSKTVYFFHFIFLAARHLVIFIWLRILNTCTTLYPLFQSKKMLVILWLSHSMDFKGGVGHIWFWIQNIIFTIEMFAVTLNVQWQQLLWSCIMVWVCGFCV